MSENGKNGHAALQGKKKALAAIVPFQFKPGQSGNPNGRPPKTTFLTLAKEEDLKLAYQRLVEAVDAGQSWAIELYLDEYLGKPTQRVEHAGKDGGPIEFESIRSEFERRISRIAQAQSTEAIPEAN